MPLLSFVLIVAYLFGAVTTLLRLWYESAIHLHRMDPLVDGTYTALWPVLIGVRVLDHLLAWRHRRAHRKETSC